MAKIHDKFVIELAEVIKGYGNDPGVDDPFCLSEFYRFYELPNIAVSRENFEKMQPVEPERKTGRWIPCSERLPIARRSVIISTKGWTGEGCYWETTEHHVIWKGYRWNATYWDDEVTAWMPLPEPYRDGGEADEHTD